MVGGLLVRLYLHFNTVIAYEIILLHSLSHYLIIFLEKQKCARIKRDFTESPSFKASREEFPCKEMRN